MVIWPVNWDILEKEKNQKEDIAVDGGKMKNIVALRISDQRIGSILQKQINNIIMAFLRRPHCRRSDRIASLDIDVGARFNQELAESKMVIDRCPLNSLTSVHNLYAGQDIGLGTYV